MALQVWLPLDGNLNNLGLSNTTVTNSGATVSTERKIGNCYSFDGSDDYINTGWGQNIPSKNISICIWVKPLASMDSKMLFSASDGSSDLQNKRLYLGVKSNAWNLAYGNRSWGYSSNATFTLNKWQHICATIDSSGKAVLYLDGNLTNVSFTYATDFNFTTNITICGRTLGYFSNCLVNDFRIYDHCLSPKEVKEISKALVLHYPLDDVSALMSKCSNITWNQLAGTYVNSRPTEVSVTNNNGKTRVTITSFTSSTDRYLVTTLNGYATIVGHKYYISCPCYFTGGFYARYNIGNGWKNLTTINGHPQSKIELCETSTTMSNHYLGILNQSAPGVGDYVEFEGDYIYNLIDLTLMFGSGNEPTLEEFELMFPKEYYPYDAGTTKNLKQPMYDCSGYGRNGTISGSMNLDSSTPRYSKSVVFPTVNDYITIPLLPLTEFTYSFWFKRDRTSLSSREMLMTGWYGLSFELNQNNTLSFLCSCLDSNNTRIVKTVVTNTTFTSTSDWYHIALTHTDGIGSKVYVNGILDNSLSFTEGVSYTTTTATIGRYNNSSYNFLGKMSDFRIYSTELSASDIKQLYDTAGHVDNLGNTFAYDMVENPEGGTTDNIAFPIQKDITLDKVFGDTVYNYQQTNCQVSFTDNGFRIYRTPNVNPTDDGNTMWGGLIIQNTDNWMGLTKGRTYLIEFDVCGVSSGAATNIAWRNLAYSPGGGLIPQPSDVTVLNPVTENFDSQGKSKKFSYQFTINDDIYKVCTSSYGSFVEGQTYLSYMHFMFGYTYAPTGTNGTDIYIDNVRLFDITGSTMQTVRMTKEGVFRSSCVVENGTNTFIDSYGGLDSASIDEL